MSIHKDRHLNNIKLLTAKGSKDTRIHDPASEYSGITLSEITKLIHSPQAKDKADASFIIPSTYRKHDGRNHAAQREHGEYWMLALDVDEGSPTLDALVNAAEAVFRRAEVLIYSSAGATSVNMKWRCLVPLTEPLTGEEYVEAQIAAFDLMRAEGIICDVALSRAGQPIYLPNVPDDRRDVFGDPNFYISEIVEGGDYLNVKDSLVWANVKFARKQAEIAEHNAAQERQRRQAQREARRDDRPNDVDPMEEFRQRYVISDLLLKYGYEQQGRSDHYRSPHQSTGSFATRDYGVHWVSMSASDASAGVGVCKDNYCWGDAFDLYAFYEHGGDMKAAVRAYAAEIKPSRNDIRNDIMQAASQSDQTTATDLDDFDFIPISAPHEARASVEFQIGEAADRAKRNEIFWAIDAQAVLKSAYLVKNWLGAGQMSVVYGPSNVGKSFFCLDMAFRIAAKTDWQECKTRGGPVLYLATEGGNAFHNRVMALRKQYGIDDVDLAVRPSPVNLLDPAADLEALLELCEGIEHKCGQKPSMIVVDTLSRALAGGDENGAPDMTSFISNCDVLRDASGAHIMIVHHSGKDTAKGARGHSSLRAATDTEIELAVDGAIRTATATKQRDLEPQPPFMFSLKVHKLGQDEDGDDVTTCTIEKASDEDAADISQKRPTGANQKTIVKAFKQLRGEGRGQRNPTGAGFPEVGQYWCIPADQLRDFSEGKMTSLNPRSSYTQALEALFAMGYMVQNEGLIWIAAKEGRASK